VGATVVTVEFVREPLNLRFTLRVGGREVVHCPGIEGGKVVLVKRELRGKTKSAVAHAWQIKERVLVRE
jgi:hypothetical protein